MPTSFLEINSRVPNKFPYRFREFDSSVGGGGGMAPTKSQVTTRGIHGRQNAGRGTQRTNVRGYSDLRRGANSRLESTRPGHPCASARTPGYCRFYNLGLIHRAAPSSGVKPQIDSSARAHRRGCHVNVACIIPPPPCSPPCGDPGPFPRR